jgi:hypothetical protein
MTYLGCQAFGKRLLKSALTEDEVGIMTLLESRTSAPPIQVVLLSEWWIRAHLTRGFEVLALEPMGFGNLPGRPGKGQGVLLLQRHGSPLTPAEWLAPDPKEPRDWPSTQNNVRQLLGTVRDLDKQLRSERRAAEDAAATSDWSRARRRLRRMLTPS